MKKRLLSLLVCAGMVGSMMTGCGGSGSSSGGTGNEGTTAAVQTGTAAGNESGEEAAEPVELTFWSMAQRKEFEDNIIAAFTKKYPEIKITPTYYSTDDIKANLKVAASSGTLPDMWYNWGGSLASYYPANGLTYDFTEYARDLFMFSFYTRGMSFIDMAYLKKSNLQNGFLSPQNCGG